MDAEYKKLTLSLKLRLTPKSTDSNRQLLTRLLLVMQFTLIQYLDTSAKMLIGIWTFVSLSEQPGLPVTQHTSGKVPLMPWTPGDTAKQRRTAGLRYSAKETLSVYGYFHWIYIIDCLWRGTCFGSNSFSAQHPERTSTDTLARGALTDTSTPYIELPQWLRCSTLPWRQTSWPGLDRHIYTHTHTHTHTQG